MFWCAATLMGAATNFSHLRTKEVELSPMESEDHVWVLLYFWDATGSQFLIDTNAKSLSRILTMKQLSAFNLRSQMLMLCWTEEHLDVSCSVLMIALFSSKCNLDVFSVNSLHLRSSQSSGVQMDLRLLLFASMASSLPIDNLSSFAVFPTTFVSRVERGTAPHLRMEQHRICSYTPPSTTSSTACRRVIAERSEHWNPPFTLCV
mmetsp:Transcript_26119/g.71633  ORF Transcript_26119/g.71633 Transcript_26119/m.71633 type:complete len:205 (-) Transcript_26119:2622-3236(-)